MIDRQNLVYKTEYHLTMVIVYAAAITITGWLTLYRTGALSGQTPDFFIRQSCWAVLAWSLFFAAVRIRFEKILQLIMPLATVALLLMLLLPVAGLSVNGMRGWYEIGPLTVQPSEIFKFIYILLLNRILYWEKFTEPLRIVLATAVIAVTAVLLLLQPDFGTMIVYLGGGAGVIYFSRVKLRYLLLTAAAAIPTAVIALLLHPYMRNRLINFFDPALDPQGGGWHLHQFAIAAARGEWTGVKSTMAVWSNSFLPLPHNDSIFAGVCEMLGFCGALLVILLYWHFYMSAYKLAYFRHDPLRRSIIESMAFMLVVQTFLHIGVNLGMLPPTGITLPLISYGGSSLVGTMLMLAVITSAGCRKKSSSL